MNETSITQPARAATVPRATSDRGRSRAVFVNLLLAIVRRDIRGHYRRSFLGPTWIVVRPVVMMVVFSMLQRIVNIKTEDTPYPIFVYSVLVPWTFFTAAVSACGSSIFGNANILKKMAVRREVFPLSAVAVATVDMLMSSVVLAGMMMWYQVPVGWSLLWVPVLFGMTVMLALGVGMFLAALGTFKNDFLLAGGFGLQLWLYLSPVIYPLKSVPAHWLPIYIMNPMVGILEGFRSVLTRGTGPDLELLAWSLPGVLLALLIGWPLFRRMSQYFADVL